MEASVYQADADLQQEHWWYVGRRRLFLERIQKVGLAAEASILDVGTSAGTNLRMLAEGGWPNVIGLDRSPDASRFCREACLGDVPLGDAGFMPFRNEIFDLVLATDIIEHLEDDMVVLREVHRVLRPGGHVLITVPAFQSLWGLQDELAHHQRRYTRKQLLQRVSEAGFVPSEQFFFNYFLFAPIWLARQWFKLRRPKVGSESEINTPLINKVFSAVFAADIKTAPRLRPPFGVSLFVMAQKPPAGSSEKPAS